MIMYLKRVDDCLDCMGVVDDDEEDEMSLMLKRIMPWRAEKTQMLSTWCLFSSSPRHLLLFYEKAGW